jgi:hypothetical protein
MSDKRSEATIPLMYNLKGLIEASCKNCGEHIAVEFTSLYPLEPSKHHPEGMEGYDNKQVPVTCSKCGTHQNIHYYLNVGVVTDIPTYEQEPRNVNVNIEGPIVSDKQMKMVIDAAEKSGKLAKQHEKLPSDWVDEAISAQQKRVNDMNELFGTKHRSTSVGSMQIEMVEELDHLTEWAKRIIIGKEIDEIKETRKEAVERKIDHATEWDHPTAHGKEMTLRLQPERISQEIEVDFSVSKPQPTPTKQFKSKSDEIKHSVIEHVANAFIEILDHFNLHEYEPVQHIEISVALSSAIEKLVAVKKSLEQ